jgi:hypothetical protein
MQRLTVFDGAAAAAVARRPAATKQAESANTSLRRPDCASGRAVMAVSLLAVEALFGDWAGSYEASAKCRNVQKDWTLNPN